MLSHQEGVGHGTITFCPCGYSHQPTCSPEAGGNHWRTLAHMDLQSLVRCCAAENRHFSQGKPNDSRFAYELFRRAVAERDDRAWEYVYMQYYSMVERWVRRNKTFVRSGESSDFLVSAAFIRFWRAVSPERFESFPTLMSLLHYLRCCADCAVIDGSRSFNSTEALSDDVIADVGDVQSLPDEEVIDQMERIEFWQYIDAQLKGDAERAVIFYSYVMGMKPLGIYRYRQDLFESVHDVYTVKRRVLLRLRHNRSLKNMVAGEMILPSA